MMIITIIIIGQTITINIIVENIPSIMNVGTNTNIIAENILSTMSVEKIITIVVSEKLSNIRR
jgi:hypothetical protein